MELSFDMTEATKARLDRLQSRLRGLGQNILAESKAAAQRLAGLVVRTALSGGNKLHRRSGSLARSITGMARASGDGLEIVVGSQAGPAEKYAGFLEYGGATGGTIRPVEKKWLAIPKWPGPATTPAGVSRYVSALDAPVPLRFVKKKNDPTTAFLVEDKPGGQKGEVWYILKKKVHVEPRHWLRDTMQAFAADEVTKAIETAVRKTTEGL